MEIENIPKEKIRAAEKILQLHRNGFGRNFSIYWDNQMDRTAIMRTNSVYVNERLFSGELRFTKIRS